MLNQLDHNIGMFMFGTSCAVIGGCICGAFGIGQEQLSGWAEQHTCLCAFGVIIAIPALFVGGTITGGVLSEIRKALARRVKSEDE